MKDANRQFKAGAEDLTKAAQLLASLLPAMQDHNEATKNLSVEARAAYALPYPRRMEKYKKLMLNYSKLIKRVGEDHDEVVPQFESHVKAAIEAIEKELRTESPGDVSTHGDLLAALDNLIKSLREPRQNIEYFRGSLSNMPDLGQKDVLRIRDNVQKSLRNATDRFAELAEKLQDLRNRIAHGMLTQN